MSDENVEVTQEALDAEAEQRQQEFEEEVKNHPLTKIAENAQENLEKQLEQEKKDKEALERQYQEANPVTVKFEEKQEEEASLTPAADAGEDALADPETQVTVDNAKEVGDSQNDAEAEKPKRAPRAKKADEEKSE